MKKVVIIGGGLIGLASAYYLRKSGLEVIVLEKNEMGRACSKGNQGWVCPALHEPVPAPGLMSESFQMLLKKDSPLYVKPSAVPQLSGWLTQFMKYCNERDFRASERALLTLSKSTLSFFNNIVKDGVEFELHKKGMLFAFLKEENLQKKFKRFQEVAENFGHEKPIYKSAEEIKKMEPALSNDIKGGIFLDNQYHVRPESFAQGLMKKNQEMGVELYPYTKVIDIERHENEIVAVKAKNKKYKADCFLLAAGAWSDTIAQRIDYNLPMTAGKGYSITITNAEPMINHPLYLGDLKAGITPFKNAIRMGGTMELSGKNTKMDTRRVQSIRSAVSKYVKEMIRGDSEREWVGMRPMTPDGLPVLGKIPHLNNMYIATGHAMVGLSMAPATGKIMTDLITLGKTNFEIDSFTPNRFVK